MKRRVTFVFILYATYLENIQYERTNDVHIFIGYYTDTYKKYEHMSV